MTFTYLQIQSYSFGNTCIYNLVDFRRCENTLFLHITYTPHNRVVEGGDFDLTLSVRPSHRLCPLFNCCSMYTVLDGFSPHLPFMTSFRGCLMQWHSTLPYIFKVIYLWHCVFHPLYLYVPQIQPMSWQCLPYHFSVNRWKVKVTQLIKKFLIWAGVL